jgi:hypothetical protein
VTIAILFSSFYLFHEDDTHALSFFLQRKEAVLFWERKGKPMPYLERFSRIFPRSIEASLRHLGVEKHGNAEDIWLEANKYLLKMV